MVSASVCFFIPCVFPHESHFSFSHYALAVTSKLYHLADLDDVSSSFGFRGEALASISDVALVEIVTKASGRPNGYRKVIKVPSVSIL